MPAGDGAASPKHRDMLGDKIQEEGQTEKEEDGEASTVQT